MRILNRLLAFIVALALVGAGIIIVVEVIAARSHAGPLIIHWHAIEAWGRRNTWKATSVELACSITVAAGLILLIPQLIRRRPSRLTIEADDATDAAVTRKGVVVTIRGAVSEVEGIATTRVKVGRHRIRVNALSAATEPETLDELGPKVEAAATSKLDALRLHPHRRVRVAINGRRNAGH
jgi:hypothetical protein